MRNFDILQSSLTSVDTLVGGGYLPGQSTIVSTVSGHGKTILAMQFAGDFVLRGHNVLFLTTDQPPWQLVMKMVSNYLNLDFSLIASTTKIAPAWQMGQVVLPYVPAVCWSTPEYRDAMIALRARIDAHLRFIDWSVTSGVNFENHLDMAVENILLQYPGWDPAAIIVDGISGALNHHAHSKRVWRAYQYAADTVIRHCKRHGRAGFITANLNPTLVTSRTTRVTHDMIAECKSLADYADNFFGITALANHRTRTGGGAVQFLCADLAKYGPGGRAKLIADFKYQRFDLPCVHWMQDDDVLAVDA